MFRSLKYAEINADATPNNIANAKAPPTNQCRRCFSFASISSRGTTGRAVNVVTSSTKCGCSTINPEGFANTRPLAYRRFYGDLAEDKERKPSDLVHENDALVFRQDYRIHRPRKDNHVNSEILSTKNAAGLRATFVKNFYTLFHAIVNSVSVETVLRQQQLRVAVRDQPVGNAHSHDANLVLQSVLFQQLEHCRTESTREISLLARDDQALRARQREQQRRVKRFHEPRIHDRGFNAVSGCELFCCFE